MDNRTPSPTKCVVPPYYQDEAVTIYNGDCRDVLPSLDAVDAIVTDPPYGIDFEYASYDDSDEAWKALMLDVVPLMRAKAGVVVTPSCQIKLLSWWYENHKPDWLIAWYKGSPGHQAHVGFNDWEPHLIWGRPKKPMHDYFQTRGGFDKKHGVGHPCPKPLEWAKWLVSRVVPEGGTVIDPFMGSGTVLRAAKDLGRKAIGIDIERAYCDLAIKRMGQGVFDLGAA